MAHSDDTGLVLPPRVAPIQIVVLALAGRGKGSTVNQEQIVDRAEKIKHELVAQGVRAVVDSRLTMRPGQRFYEWDRKGVPLRVEVGPRELEQGQVSLKGRIHSQRQSCSLQGNDCLLYDAVMLCSVAFELDCSISVLKMFELFCADLSLSKRDSLCVPGPGPAND